MTDNTQHPSIPSPVLPLDLDDFTYEQVETKEQIGTGGDANVYRAIVSQNDIEHTIAVKEPRFEGTIQQEVIERFEKEAETWSKLDDHPNVVTVYSWGAKSLPWLGLEYMDGGTLESHLGDLAIEEALWLAGRIAEGIQQGHRHGVAHLDLKPSNILLRDTPDGKFSYPKVSDWGLAQLLLEHSKSVEGLSPMYAAPEQFDTEEYGKTDNITDIYQFGTILYALCTGEPPFTGSATSVMQDVLTEVPTPPSKYNQEISKKLDEIILKSLSKNKEDRYESITLLRTQLDNQFNQYSGFEAFENVEEVEGTVSINKTSSADQPTEQPKRTPSKNSESSSIVSRRAALGTLGVSTVGAGAFALSQFMDEKPTPPNPPSTSVDLERIWSLPDLSGNSITSNVAAWRFEDSVFVGQYEQQSPNKFMRVGSGGSVLWSDSNIPDSHTPVASDFATDGTNIILGLSRESSYTFQSEYDDSNDGALIYCYDAEEGNKKWEYQTASGVGRFTLKAVDIINEVVVAAVDGLIDENKIAIHGIDISSGELIWTTTNLLQEQNISEIQDIIAYDSNVYVGTSYGMFVLDSTSGEKINQERSEISPRYSLTREDNIVYGGGLSYASAFNLDSLTNEWRADISGSTNAEVGEFNFCLTTRNGYVYSLNKETGEQNWRQRVQGRSGDICLTSDYVWVSDSEGLVRGYRSTTGERTISPRVFAEGEGAADEDIPLVGWEDTLFIGGTESGKFRIING